MAELTMKRLLQGTAGLKDLRTNKKKCDAQSVYPNDTNRLTRFPSDTSETSQEKTYRIILRIDYDHGNIWYWKYFASFSVQVKKKFLPN